MAGRTHKVAERHGKVTVGNVETDLPVTFAEATTASEVGPEPDRECTDVEAMRLAGFLVERVRMFKLPNNVVYLVKAPDGTVRVWSKANG